MNRLVLIGNGFDLAHGLKTSYKDFITDYYCSSINEFHINGVYEDELLSINSDNSPSNATIKTFDQAINFFDNARQQNIRLSRKFEFLDKLRQKCNLEKWVDIENEYFKEIKVLLNNTTTLHQIKELNEKFEFLKNKLEQYLLREINKDNKLRNTNRFNHLFCGQYTAKSVSANELKIDNVMILNFNYTWMWELYKQSILDNYQNNNQDFSVHNLHPNFIHGELNNRKNPIIFGFGDEYDADYKKFEDLQNNELFRHVKSFAYFRTENYQNLIRFMDMDKFEVGIAGHSCGLSDRTLLKHIFEHTKCKRIKIFHHKRHDDSTNYTELTYEIARHFTDKKKMREKIVPFNANDKL